jgi:hypothetical protein
MKSDWDRSVYRLCWGRHCFGQHLLAGDGTALDNTCWLGTALLWTTRAVKLCQAVGVGLEVNADKTNHMVMSRDQNAERSHNTAGQTVL